MTAAMVTTMKDTELRRIIQFNKTSKSRGISIPTQWLEKLGLTTKDYVKLELRDNEIIMEPVKWLG